MNILVIGNGFDLAHGLPTKYGDFLELCRMIKTIYDVDNKEDADQAWANLCLKVSNGIDKLRLLFMQLYSVSMVNEIEFEDDGDSLWKYIVTNTEYDEFVNNINNNIWIDYFLLNPIYQKENWIDFEGEISRVIQTIEETRNLMVKGDDVTSIDDSRGKIIKAILKVANKSIYDIFASVEDVDHFVGILENDLKRLIRALEIYLADYIEKIGCNVISPDIQNIRFDKVLSFNYTDIFSKLYDANELAEYDYIHGRVDLKHTINTNNMVLGIDEYLPDDRKNRDVEFISFKKYFQRIHKETGCKYKEWIDEIKIGYEEYQRRKNDAWVEIVEALKNGSINQIPYQKQVFCEKMQEECPTHKLYIFGHSLDVTDGDILRDLILNDNVHTTIYYLNKDVMGQQIANLVKVIGQDELIRRTGGRTKTIEFKLQQDMVERV